MNDFRHGGLTRRRTGEGDKVVAHPRRSRFRSTAAASTAPAETDIEPHTQLNNHTPQSAEQEKTNRENEDQSQRIL
jgi:hypothetical protein